jgi:hypothetical protein
VITVKEYLQLKKNGYIERERKYLKITPNGRSTDYIIPSIATGCDYQCTYCVEKGTLISTPDGAISVEKIQETSLVFSYNNSLQQLEVAHASYVLQREVNLIYEIQVADTILYATGEHPIMTQRGWVEAQYLADDDVVLYDESYKE